MHRRARICGLETAPLARHAGSWAEIAPKLVNRKRHLNEKKMKRYYVVHCIGRLSAAAGRTIRPRVLSRLGTGRQWRHIRVLSGLRQPGVNQTATRVIHEAISALLACSQFPGAM